MNELFQSIGLSRAVDTYSVLIKVCFWRSLPRCLHPQGSPGTPLAARFSKMLQTYYQSTWYHIPTDFNLHQQHCKKKKNKNSNHAIST